MKKLLLILSLVSIITYAEELFRYLHYKYNQNVIITISNVPCPLPELKDLYPYAAIATRIDGERLLACYTHKADNVVIQWYQGDQSIFPANVFITSPELDKSYKQKPNV